MEFVCHTSTRRIPEVSGPTATTQTVTHSFSLGATTSSPNWEPEMWKLYSKCEPDEGAGSTTSTITYGMRAESHPFSSSLVWNEGGSINLYEPAGGGSGCFIHAIVIPEGPATRQVEGKIGGMEAPGRYFVEVRLKVNLDEVMPGEREMAVRTKFVEKVMVASKAQLDPQDVRLHFPRVNQDLWAKASLLVSNSPYFKTLLSSEFEEGLNRTTPTSIGKRKRAEDSSQPDEEGDGGVFGDSDDETDQQFHKRPSTFLNLRPTFPFKSVNITQSAYTTYVATLCYIETGFIRFSPLSSSFNYPESPLSSSDSSDPDGAPNRVNPRLEKLSKFHQSSPLLPLRPSPKSIYRLAHYLELPKLQERALASFKKQLTTSNVIIELVSDASRAYPELQKVTFDFAKANWRKGVKASAGLLEVREKLKAEELPGSVGEWTLRGKFLSFRKKFTLKERNLPVAGRGPW